MFWRSDSAKLWLKDYDVMRQIGKGMYGTVYEGVERKSGHKVALKKLSLKVCEPALKRTLRELKALRLLCHQNIVGLDRVIHIKDTREVCACLELMDCDLKNIIKSKQQIPTKHRQYLSHQLLGGLRYLHECGIVHRDLKPQNILVNSSCDLKICDFGLSRYKSTARICRDDVEMSGYVQTRWYRAPELLLLSPYYDEKIDIWSAGCIIAELIRHRTLFPGDDSLEQIYLIGKVVGPYAPDSVETFKAALKRQWEAKKVPTEIQSSTKEMVFFISKVRPSDGLDKYLVHSFPEEIDFMQNLLTVDPEARASASNALEHPYLSHLHRPEEDNCKERPACAEAFAFEEERCDKSELERLILNEADIDL